MGSCFRGQTEILYSKTMSPCKLSRPTTKIYHTHLKHAFIQQSHSKYSHPLSADLGVKTSEQVQGVQFDAV